MTHKKARPTALDSGDARDAIVEAITAGKTQAQAAELLGLTRATVARRVRSDNVFGARVRAARSRAQRLGTEARRAPEQALVDDGQQLEAEAAEHQQLEADLDTSADQQAEASAEPARELEAQGPVVDAEPMTTIAGALESDAGLLGLPSSKWVIALLVKTAKNSEHRGCPRAQQILAELVLGPLAAERDRSAQADLVSTDAGPEPLQVRMLVPSPVARPRVLPNT